MKDSVLSTRFAGISRPRAAGVLALAAMAILAGFTLSAASVLPLIHPGNTTHSDAEVLERIVKRVHSGEGYYAAAGTALRENGYPLRSVFNWRPPLYAWVLGSLPSLAPGRILLVSLVLLATVITVRFMVQREDYLGAVLCFWLIPGASWPSFTSQGLLTLEVSAGVLILLSVFSYAARLWWAGFVLAMLALLVRELAAPYIVTCVLIAVAAKRWREAGAWIAGLILYGVYFAFHASHVLASIRPTDPPGFSWIAFGGLRFILMTAAQHMLLFRAPLGVSAVYLPIAVLGATAIPGELGTRVVFALFVYLLFFAVAGRPLNAYWGFLDSPLLAFGAAWAPVALMQLGQAIKRPAVTAS